MKHFTKSSRRTFAPRLPSDRAREGNEKAQSGLHLPLDFSVRWLTGKHEEPSPVSSRRRDLVLCIKQGWSSDPPLRKSWQSPDRAEEASCYTRSRSGRIHKGKQSLILIRARLPSVPAWTSHALLCRRQEPRAPGSRGHPPGTAAEMSARGLCLYKSVANSLLLLTQTVRLA
nr:uncharacterized protein LOC112980820 [Dromaius novaehollandiae]